MNRSLRAVLTALHALLKLKCMMSRPRTFGAHALAFTPAGDIVLVKLRYAGGWRLPGGGRHENETAEDAVLRELREEIGLTSHGAFQRACDIEEAIDFKRDLASLLIVRDVEYQRPSWSWEVEDLLETSLDDLPHDLSPRAAKWIEAVIEAQARRSDQAPS